MKHKLDLYQDLPGYQNLSQEQKEIVKQWDKERAIRFGIVDEMFAALKKGDKKLYNSLHEKYEESTEEFCVHERSIWSRCGSCEEIEKICHGLNPDEDFPEDE